MEKDIKALVPDILELPCDSFDDFKHIIGKVNNVKLGIHDDKDYFEKCFYFLVSVEGLLIGSCAIRENLTELGRTTLGNIAIGIRPSERRKGYANKLLNLLINECKERGFDEIIVCCYEENNISQKLIQKADVRYDGDIVSKVTQKKIKRYVIKGE